MLKQRAMSATMWSGADIFLRQGLQFVVSIVLARLLSPEEFGTIALLYLFTGIASAFVDSGFSSALIQRQDNTQADESTVFWFNLAMGALVALALWIAAPWIASFYRLPVLVALTKAMALNVFLSALGSIHNTLLTKQLNFRAQMMIGAVATILSGTVAIWMAMRGYGVWSLVALTLLATACTTALLWVVDPWRPTREFSAASARRLFGFGGYVLASGLLDTIYNRLYTVLIGKMFGLRELGYYNRADGTKQMPVGIVSGILSRVAFPIFSAAADDPVKLRRGVQLSVRGMMLINVPMMLGLASIAGPVVLALFGAQWLPAAPIMRVLCLAGIFWPLHVININVLMAQGHSHLLFRLEIAKKALGVALLVVGAGFGVMGIAWSMVAFGAVAFLINAHYTRRFLDYGAGDQLRDAAPIVVVSVAMSALTGWLGTVWIAHPWIVSLGISAIGAIVFVSFSLLFKLQAIEDASGLFRGGRAIR